MDIKVVVALISLAGIALGALISGFGYFYKVRAERLKTTKETLYYLLEFRAHFKASSFTPSALSAEYLSMCNNFFRKKQIPEGELPEELIQLVNQTLTSIIDTITPKLSNEFLTAYETSLKALAKDNPILAYKLRGKEAYASVFEMINTYTQQLKTIEEFKGQGLIPQFMEKQIREMNDLGFSDQLKQMDLDISLVATRCGLITRWQVRKILQHKQPLVLDLRDSDIEEKLELLLRNYLALQAAPLVETEALKVSI